MTVQSYAGRGPRPSSLADVLELILDKGLVIDAYVRVSLVGIELLTIDARIVVASVDTYLRFAEATNRLDLQAASNSEGLPQMIGELTENGASRKTKGALSGAAEGISNLLGGGDDDRDEDEDDSRDGHRRRPARARSSGDGRARSRESGSRENSSRSRGTRTATRRRRSDEDDEDE